MALTITDPKGFLQPYSNNMPFPGQIDPTGGFAPSYSSRNPPLPPANPFRTPVVRAPAARPNINVPVGQVAQTPQPGAGNLWDALRALFSGQQAAPQGQGMTGMLQQRGQAGASTDALGNPFNRFG